MILSAFESLPSGWRDILGHEWSKTYLRALNDFLDLERAAGQVVYPRAEWIFRALQLVDYKDVRVVILGQDPYHGEKRGVIQANGLSFGVPSELTPKPPSLKNIFKEMQVDLGLVDPHPASELTGWAEQGVLLLNTVLTVRRGEAFSHRGKGWETFVDAVLAALNLRPEPIVFVLWGAAAQEKRRLLTETRHRILESAHPSPLSAYRGFFGSRPFSKVNQILVDHWGQQPLDWAKTGRKTASVMLSPDHVQASR